MPHARKSTSLSWLICGLGILVVSPRAIHGQGCMPLRFTSPSLAGLQDAYFQPHEWQVGITARRVTTDKYYAGTAPAPGLAPFGEPLDLDENSMDLSVTYAASGRTSFVVTVPFAYSTASQFFPDGNRHQISSSGLGDINAFANVWVADPATHTRGNLAIGVGAKAPTGSNHVDDDFWVPGAVIQQPVPQTIQLGDGGWALLAQGQAFYQVGGRAALYASGQYSASLKSHTDVLWTPANALWAVADVYSARAGLSYGVMPERGVSLSLGGRIDGTPVRNIITGRDDSFRHAGFYTYVEPGLSIVRARDQITLNVPVRVGVNYYTMQTAAGLRIGAGGVPDYLIYAGYSRRF